MQLPKGLLRRLVAGALYAALSLQLLYDLNPQIEISTGRLLLVTLAYALYGGFLFGLLLWMIRLIRKRLVPPEEQRPHGFGFIVVVSVYCALLFWLHRHTFEIYLPLDAVRNLSRAAPILGILTVTLAALWLVERTALGWRRQFLFLSGIILICAALVILSMQRSTLETESAPTVAAPELPAGDDIIVVTIGYLPHDWLVRMDAEEISPFFSELRQSGFFGRLQPFPTTSRRAIWASLLTGKLPYRHGVTGRHVWRVPWEEKPFLILPNALGIRRWALPAASRTELESMSGNARAVWEIIESAGGSATVVSTVDSAPAIEPVDLGEWLERRLHSRGAAGPDAAALLATDLALVATLRESDSRASFVHLAGFHRLQEIFGSRNELPDSETAEGALYRDYVAAIGDALEQLREARPDALLIVTSPSAIRPNYLPQDPIDVARARIRPESGEADGFVAANGPLVASSPPSVLIVELPDLVPTILYAAGLPVGRDMDGGVILEMFDDAKLGQRPLQLIPSWEMVSPRPAQAR